MPNSAQIKPLGSLAQAIGRLGQRLYQPPSNSISNISQTAWPNPLQPVAPIGPKGSEPLGWGFWQGQNLTYTPRAELQYTAAQLRALSLYPLARACIQNIKDQVCGMPWRIQLIRLPDETEKEHKKRGNGDSNISKLTALLKQPNPQQNWRQLLRRLLEDLLVIDAPAMLVRRLGNGQVAELRWTDGADIVQYIDQLGYIPMGVDKDGKPDVAYAQLWEGIPRIDLAWNQLVYRPYNYVPRGRDTSSSQLYGYSPTEAASDEIKIGINRLRWVGNWYTEGSMTDMIQVVPPGQSPGKIAEAEDYQNSELAGNLSKRRQLRLLQGFSQDGKDQILFPKAGSLTDPYDDLHIRKLCFHYGVSPQRLLHMATRANAEANQTAAEEEGTLPWVGWVEDTFNFTIQTMMGLKDYEITLDPTRQADELKEAQTAKLYVDSGISTRNEVREAKGDDPSTQPEADLLTVTIPTGVIPLDLAVQLSQANVKTAENPPKPVIAAPPKPGQPNGKEPVKVAKLGPSLNIQTHESSLATIERSRFQKAIHQFFQKEAKAAAERVSTVKKLRKASDQEERQRILDAAFDGITWQELIDPAERAIESAGIAGHSIGISQIPNVRISANLVEAQRLAQTYAHDRAAEMVGMRYGTDGTLRTNPDAKWAISDTTRETLKADIEQAFSAETKIEDLATVIRDSNAFSDARADMIARTEVAIAQNRGTYDAWKTTDAVKTVRWVMSADHDESDECDLNIGVGAHEFGKEFPTGDLMPPAHPNCRCLLVPVDIKQ